MTTIEGDPDGEQERPADAGSTAAETPTRLRQAATGIADAQAWKGQQIAKGWRMLVRALRKQRESGTG